ncbi:MAG TPA: hypothetical protein ENG51_18010 [Deltaproteobacteria bacterium]|nr:hypothetical protein [Deltaproteobacteria bacterium]
MSMKKEALPDKFEGGMLGCALGDAIGEIAFRCHTIKDLEAEIEKTDVLIYTDDTAMALGLAESLIRKNDIDQQDIGDTFARNFFKEPWRGYASGPPTIFSLVKNSGCSYVEVAKTLFGGSGSFGNGAAMRIVPVGLRFFDSSHLYDKAAASAEVTHAHPVGKDGAAIQAMAIGLAVRTDPGFSFDPFDFVDKLVQKAKTDEIKSKLRLVKDLLQNNAPPKEAIKSIGCSVAVHESMPFSLYSFLKHPTSFKDCLYCAVLHGGDRDTLGAMACSISGAFLGIRSLPVKWLDKLENEEYITELARELLKSRSTSC